MINFILVEDNIIHKRRAEEIINKYMLSYEFDYKIKAFDKMNLELKEVINDNKENNIYILDFELQNTTAIEIAKLIRNIDWTSPIIIFTAHGGMALETFKQKLGILDFISKQYQDEKNLFEAFDICIKQLKLKRSLKYTYKNVYYNIDYDNIYYIYRENCDRKTYIITEDKKYETNIGIKEIKEKLDKNFVLTHRSCIVNMKKVKIISWKDRKIVFDNDKETGFLSKKNKKELMCYEQCN